MSNRTINRILLCIISILTVSIGVLIVLIYRRPRYININDKQTAIVNEVSINEVSIDDISMENPFTDDASQNELNEQDTQASIEVSNALPAPIRGKTSDKVNIREKANENSRVLKTVEAGYTFEIIEVQSDGWTKIKYEDSSAYISSNYVILIKQ